jgi:hypothetical protein
MLLLSLCLVKHNPLKEYGGVDILISISLNSELVGILVLTFTPWFLYPQQNSPGNYCIIGWVGILKAWKKENY